jgi:hypothetical protein
MSIIELKDNIYIVKNAFEYEKCNEMATFIKENKTLHKYVEVDEKYSNNVECTFITINDNLSNKYILELDEIIKNKIHDIIKLVKSKNIFFKGRVCDNGYTLRQIHGGTVLHTDGILEIYKGYSRPRLLSIIINLNEDYDGGEFNFPKQDVKVKLKMGDAICFPPYWTHPHEVSPVLLGQYRYTINTWILNS